MDHAQILMKLESLEYLNCKASDQVQISTLKMVRFNEFVKVHRQQFKRNNQMSPEDIIIKDAHYVVLIMGISII